MPCNETQVTGLPPMSRRIGQNWSSSYAILILLNSRIQRVARQYIHHSNLQHYSLPTLRTTSFVAYSYAWYLQNRVFHQMGTSDRYHPEKPYIYLDLALYHITICKCRIVLRLHIFGNQIQMILLPVITLFIQNENEAHIVVQMIRTPSEASPLFYCLHFTAWSSPRQIRTFKTDLHGYRKPCTPPSCSRSQISLHFRYNARSLCVPFLVDNASQCSEISYLTQVPETCVCKDTPDALQPRSIVSAYSAALVDKHTSSFPAFTVWSTKLVFVDVTLASRQTRSFRFLFGMPELKIWSWCVRFEATFKSIFSRNA